MKFARTKILPSATTVVLLATGGLRVEVLVSTLIAVTAFGGLVDFSTTFFSV